MSTDNIPPQDEVKLIQEMREYFASLHQFDLDYRRLGQDFARDLLSPYRPQGQQAHSLSKDQSAEQVTPAGAPSFPS